MKTVVSTPTVRSAEYQTRVEQLAQDIFTGRELQELRTRIPDIQFVIEEAELYKRNLVLRNHTPHTPPLPNAAHTEETPDRCSRAHGVVPLCGDRVRAAWRGRACIVQVP
eukprot:jgi/Mesvir1/6915/Mv09069-RA.1